MAIEVPVRKEIASFKSRPVGGLTVRQLVCFFIALPVGFGGGYLLAQQIGYTAASNIIIPLVLPIFIVGLFEKNGYTLEKYLGILWRHRIWPQKTVYKTENAVSAYMPENEIKTDLSIKMLSYTPRTLRKNEEVNCTFHWTKQEINQNIRATLKECRKPTARKPPRKPSTKEKTAPIVQPNIYRKTGHTQEGGKPAC